tara:strand:+ start:39736 stop:40809 length:1074 start_codon:yes stop_codon:yes gene_type:complete
MNKTPVIQLIDSLDVGGAEMMSVNIANLLNKETFESHICVTRNEGTLKSKLDNDIGYLYLNKSKVIDIKALRTFVKYLRSNSIKIIHAHSTSIYFAVFAKLVCWNLKIIWHDHYGFSSDYSKRPLKILKMTSIFINVILSVNKNLLTWAQENLLCRKTYYFSNFAAFKDSNEKTTLKGTKGNRIVCVAGLRPQKDHFNLIKAFSEVIEDTNDWSLHIVGNDYGDEYSLEVKKMTQEDTLRDRVFFYGARHDIENILSQSDIAVLSSKSEGLPVSLLEYGLGKVAAVCTNVGQCSEVLTDKNLLVDKEDSKLLADAIKLLIKNPKFRETSGSELYKNVFTNFSKEAYNKKLTEVYKNV